MTSLTAVKVHNAEHRSIRFALSTLVRKVRSWREKRQAVMALQGLNPAMLRDIGLHASEIRSVIYTQAEGRRMTHDRF